MSPKRLNLLIWPAEKEVYEQTGSDNNITSMLLVADPGFEPGLASTVSRI